MNTDIVSVNNVLLKTQDDMSKALFIKKLVDENPKHYNRMLRHKYQDLVDWIYEKTPGLNDALFEYKLGIRIYWIFKGFTDFPKCPTCGKPIGYRKNVVFNTGTGFYFDHCSIPCSSNDPAVQSLNKATNLQRYGTEWPMQNEDVQAKSVRTSLENYGTTTPMASEKVKAEIRATCMELYGVTNVFAAEWCKTKIKKSLFDKYGVEHANQHPDFFKKVMCRYEFEGAIFASAPELAYYLWLNANGISFRYQPDDMTIEYSYEGKKHLYFPDFVLLDTNQLVEIKGDQFFVDVNDKSKGFKYPYRKCKTEKELVYLDGLAQAKFKCLVKNRVIIYAKADYRKFEMFVSERYGRDFLKNCRQSRT